MKRPSRIKLAEDIVYCGHFSVAVRLIKKYEVSLSKWQHSKAGKVSSTAKQRAARENGKLGGRPRSE